MSDTPIWITLLSDVLTLGALSITASAFLKGLRQYKEGQDWKRKEYVATIWDKMRNDRLTRNALLMLDWNSRRICVLDENDQTKLHGVEFNDRTIGASLTPDTIQNRPSYGEIGAAIRDSFDELLVNLEKIEIMIQSNLIHIDDVYPYLSYWMRLICDPFARGPQGSLRARAIRNLWLYILHYEFELVPALARRFGYNELAEVKKGGAEDNELVAECLAGNVWHDAPNEQRPAIAATPSTPSASA